MTETVTPGRVQGTVAAPPSKSHLQRALVIAALTSGRTVVLGYRTSADVDAMVGIVRTLGATVAVDGEELVIKSTGRIPEGPLTIHCGESGLAARMFSAIAAIFSNEITVTGEGSLLKRPFGMVAEALSQLGKKVETNEGALPLRLSGSIANNELHLDGSMSSQVLSGLLIALPLAGQDTVIHVTDLRSKAYAQLTIDTLRQFGMEVINEQFGTFRVRGGQRPVAARIIAEGDWSGAAFLLAAGAVAGHVTVSGLDPASSQPDRAIRDVLQEMGVKMELGPDRLSVTRSHLRPFTFDATDCPDLFPPLAGLAANSTGQCRIKGVRRLLHKESDRCASILHVLHAADIEASVENDTMTIRGGKASACTVSAHNDHRIAMLGALLALNADGPMTIEGAEAVNKSYPHFFQDLASLRPDNAS